MENTARNFALQLGSLIALYTSLSAMIIVIFSVVTIAFPDAVDGYWEHSSAQDGIRIGIAMLVVFFPVYLVVTRLVHQIRRKETGAYLTLTKWLVYLSLLVGGGILLGDLVTVIVTFLNGEITVRFALKAFALLVIIGSAFGYYIFDARGYWNTHEEQSKLAGAAAIFIVIVVLILGFTHSDSPTKLRDAKIDAAQINDFMTIQSYIGDHINVTKTLPLTLGDIYNKPTIPTAPEGRTPYIYSVVNATTFKICGNFKTEITNPSNTYMQPMEKLTIVNPDNWDHGTGEVCFERIVNIPQ